MVFSFQARVFIFIFRLTICFQRRFILAVRVTIHSVWSVMVIPALGAADRYHLGRHFWFLGGQLCGFNFVYFCKRGALQLKRLVFKCVVGRFFRVSWIFRAVVVIWRSLKWRIRFDLFFFSFDAWLFGLYHSLLLFMIGGERVFFIRSFIFPLGSVSFRGRYRYKFFYTRPLVPLNVSADSTFRALYNWHLFRTCSHVGSALTANYRQGGVGVRVEHYLIRVRVDEGRF